MLHTVNKSPFDNGTLETCLKFAQRGSAVLLIEDAVYAATRGNAAEAKVREAMTKLPVYALAPEACRRAESPIA